MGAIRIDTLAGTALAGELDRGFICWVSFRRRRNSFSIENCAVSSLVSWTVTLAKA